MLHFGDHNKTQRGDKSKGIERNTDISVLISIFENPLAQRADAGRCRSAMHNGRACRANWSRQGAGAGAGDVKL